MDKEFLTYVVLRSSPSYIINESSESLFETRIHFKTFGYEFTATIYKGKLWCTSPQSWFRTPKEPLDLSMPGADPMAWLKEAVTE